MPKLFRRVSVVLLTLLATALPAAGQTPGAIQGRIIDDVSGRPIARSTVSASGTGGEHRATTDDDGRYELARLVPGTYRVYASAPGYSEWQYGQLLATRGGDEVAVRAGEATRRINIRLERAGAISGRIFDSEGNPMPNVEIELLGDRVGGGRRFSNVAVAFAQTDAVGTYRLDDLLPGQYYVRAHTGRVLSLANDAPVESSDEVYTATLFPDATEIAAAQPLRIGPGQELVGIDFELATVPTHTLSGVATNLVGPFFASPLVTATRAGRPTPVASTRVLADGSFELSGLVPGDYELRVTNADERFPPLAVKGFDVVVAGDMTDLVVRAPAVARVRGQIVTDDAAPLPFDPSALGIATEVRPGNGLQMRMSRDASIAPDGSFVVDGVVGPTLLDLSGLPPGWSLLAVRLGGVDITYDPTNFSSGRSDVEMVITGRTPASPAS